MTYPLKVFDDRSKSVRFTRLKIASGILPFNLLWDKDNLSKEYDEIALICPENWFSDRSKSTKDGKDKHQEGIVPFSKLPSKANDIRFENPVILLGRGPSNLLCERSK